MKISAIKQITYSATFALFLLKSPLLWAESSQELVTFDQIARIAFEQNLGLRIEKQKRQTELENKDATFKNLLPSLSLSSSISDVLDNSASSSNEITSFSTSLVLQQSVYQPALYASWKRSELTLEKADQTLRRQAELLLFELKKAWYSLLKEQILYTESEKSLARLKQHKKNAEAFYRNGEIWRNDLLQAQVRVARGEQELFSAKNRLLLARSQINLILNRSLDTDLKTQAQLIQIDFNTPLETLNELAISNRLDLKQNQTDISIAKKDSDIARAGYKPSVNFTLSTGLSSTEFNYDPSTSETTAALNLSWNFWQFGQARKEVAAAESKLRVARLQKEQKSAEILLEVRTAYLAVKESEHSLAVSEQALVQSNENFRISQIRYKEQLGSSNDVLDAQDLLTQTETDRITALSQYLTAIAELNLAVGQGVKVE